MLIWTSLICVQLPTECWPQWYSLTRVTLNHPSRTPIHTIREHRFQCTYPLFISEAEFLSHYVPIYASIVLKMHNNAYLTYIRTYIHIITYITHVVNTYKYNYMKIPHKFGHIRVNFLQSVRLQVTYLLRNPINVCWNPQNSARFFNTINLRGHMPRFTLKMNVFPSISLEIP